MPESINLIQMNRAFYIVGIVFSVIFMVVTGYYAEEVDSAKMYDLFSSYSYDSYSSYSSYYSSGLAESYTSEAATWSLFFFLSFIAIDLLGLLKVKTTTVKVLSIIGLSLSGIFLLWNFVVLSSPGSVSFDEVAPAWIFYTMVMLAFTIIGVVQSSRYYSKASSMSTSIQDSKQTSDLLDS